MEEKVEEEDIERRRRITCREEEEMERSRRRMRCGSSRTRAWREEDESKIRLGLVFSSTSWGGVSNT